MAANGQLVFTDVDKVTFKGVGDTSNAVIDTTTGKIGVGVDSPDANLHVLGNCFVSTNLELGGTMTMGTVTVNARHELSAITATGNTTPHTVEFQNAETGLVTTGNVSVGKELTVTGNVAVDTDTLFVDTVNDRVGIGKSRPEYMLHIEDASNPRIMLENTDTVLSQNQDIGSILFKQNDNTTTGTGIIGKIRMSSVIAPPAGTFYGESANMIFSVGNYANDNANIDALTIRGNGDVGIGTTSPAKKLHVEHYGSAIGDFEGIRIANHASLLHATVRPAYEFVVSDIAAGTGIGNGKFAIGYRGTTSASRTDRLVIDNSGNVGIGTTNPQQNLHVHEAGSGQVVIAVTNDTTGSGNNDGIHFGIDNAENGFVWHKPNKQLIFATDNTERMRVDSGTTSTVAGGTAGKGVSFAHAGIAIDRTWNNYPSITVMNENSTGDTNQSQLRVHGCNVSYSSYPSTSGSDFGCSIYIDGTYQTNSDRRFKTNITTIDNALDKVMSLSGKRYQLLNSDGSIRTAVSTNDYKYGFIAQDLEALGLDETFIHYTEEDDGTEGYNKAYSVDYDSFIPLLVNAIKEQNVIINTMRDQLENERSRNDALEARISALENA